MAVIPSPKSEQWYSIIGFFFVINTLSLFGSRALLEQSLTTTNILAFTLVAVFVTVSLVTGYFGRKLWFIASALGNIAGIVYLLYLSVTNANEGWTDLTSLFSYITLTAAGFFIGAVLEIPGLLKKLFRTS